MKKIFVTGGSGFIGSALIDKLIQEGYEIASYDAYMNFTDNPEYYKKCLRLREKLYKQPSVVFRGDIRDREKLERSVRNFQPDIIVHLAGLSMARVLEKYK
ncbi:MAG: GDP-mannose 4,6-dehydratase, partial [Candidatus Calescibacterium sp.]|nr:GDP-mannose 4,6-dehydratase [Candidatus Calescibacterium sp.]